MDDKVIEMMRIKLEDMPRIERRFHINSARCVTLGRQIVNNNAEERLSKLRKVAFK